MVLGLKGQSSRLGLRLAAIKRGFELYKYLPSSSIHFAFKVATITVSSAYSRFELLNYILLFVEPTKIDGT